MQKKASISVIFFLLTGFFTMTCVCIYAPLFSNYGFCYNFLYVIPLSFLLFFLIISLLLSLRKLKNKFLFYMGIVSTIALTMAFLASVFSLYNLIRLDLDIKRQFIKSDHSKQSILIEQIINDHYTAKPVYFQIYYKDIDNGYIRTQDTFQELDIQWISANEAVVSTKNPAPLAASLQTDGQIDDSNQDGKIIVTFQ